MSADHKAEDRALKAAGYARLPRLWVPKDMLTDVIADAEVFGADVKRIRRKARLASKVDGAPDAPDAADMTRPGNTCHDC